MVRRLFGIKELYLGLLLASGYLALSGYVVALWAFGVIAFSCVWGARG